MVFDEDASDWAVAAGADRSVDVFLSPQAAKINARTKIVARACFKRLSMTPVFIWELSLNIRNHAFLLLPSYVFARNISSGGLFNTPRLFKSPITTVNNAIIKNNTSAGIKFMVNGISKLYFANSHVPAMAITMPVNAEKAPKNKYSNAVMANICLRLAPSVRNRTLSWMRWYLLILTEAISTTMPVMMLKALMKRMI